MSVNHEINLLDLVTLWLDNATLAKLKKKIVGREEQAKPGHRALQSTVHTTVR